MLCLVLNDGSTSAIARSLAIFVLLEGYLKYANTTHHRTCSEAALFGDLEEKFELNS